MSAGVFFLVLAQCETHARRMQWARHALHSVDEWLELRQMRNVFALDASEAWDYPENGELQAAVVNQVFSGATRLAPCNTSIFANQPLQTSPCQGRLKRFPPDKGGLRGVGLRCYCVLVEILQHVKKYVQPYLGRTHA